MRTQDVTLKTCRRRWMIGRSSERRSGISVLAARRDDDDEVGKVIKLSIYSKYGNYTTILRAILNKSLRQHPTMHQVYGHLPPITKTIQVRQTRHAGHCWRSRGELISDVLPWIPHIAEQKRDNQLEYTYSSYVRIRHVALKTCQRKWTIGRCGEWESGISVPVVRHDDDDDDVYIYIYICIWK